MPSSETFGGLCRRVCEEQGWELLPSGVRIPTEADRHQLVSLEFADQDGEEFVRLWTIIGDAARLDAARLEAALRLNMSLPHGALALHGGQLVMVETLPLHDAGAEEIRAALEYLASQADHYEKTMYGTDQY